MINLNYSLDGVDFRKYHALRGDFFVRKLSNKPQEVIALALMDCEGRIVGYSELYRDSVTDNAAQLKEFARLALTGNAASVMLAHNEMHWGDYDKSLQLHWKFRQMLNVFGIPLTDHLVVCGLAVMSVIEIESVLLEMSRDKQKTLPADAAGS